MWIVYNINDSWECGWTVKSEAEAIKQCKENTDLAYKWVG